MADYVFHAQQKRSLTFHGFQPYYEKLYRCAQTSSVQQLISVKLVFKTFNELFKFILLIRLRRSFGILWSFKFSHILRFYTKHNQLIISIVECICSMGLRVTAGTEIIHMWPQLGRRLSCTLCFESNWFSSLNLRFTLGCWEKRNTGHSFD